LDVISLGIGIAIGFVLGFIIAYIFVSKSKKTSALPVGQTQPQIQPQPIIPQQPHYPTPQMQMHTQIASTPSQPPSTPGQPIPPFHQYPQQQTQQPHIPQTMPTTQYPLPQPNIPPQTQAQPIPQQQTQQLTQTTQTQATQQISQMPQPHVSPQPTQQPTVQVDTQTMPKPPEQSTIQTTTQTLEPKVQPQPQVQQDIVPPVQTQPEKHAEQKEEEDRFHKGKKCRLCGTPLEEGDTCKGCTAKVALSMAENSIAELKAEGAKIYVDARIKDAKTALDNNDFENAIKIAHEIQEQGKEIGQKFSEAKRQLDAANSTLTEVEKAGVDVSQARTTLTLATSFFEDGEYDKCLRYGVKAERLAKDLADKAKVTMKKPPEPAPTTSPTTTPQQKQETQPPTSMKATLCNICRGVIKPGLPIIKCICGRQFHEACASRVGDCPSCGRKI
ncbi:MAG: hypothetical protein QXT63_01045, partial [Thermoplasmata archaeon]